MKNKFYLWVAFASLCCLLSCKKDNHPAQIQQNNSLENGLLNFSVNGQLVDAVIDTTHNSITATVATAANMKNLTINFTLASQVKATVNNSPVNSGAAFNFTGPVNFKVTSADGKRSTTFVLTVQTKLQYFGLAGNVAVQKSLDKDYNFYFDQWDGSKYQAINCGPTVTSMAIKWADSSFTGTPAEAREDITEGGDWWTTDDIQSYLVHHQINFTVDTLSDLDGQVKKSIDGDNLVILCLDMSYVTYNMNVEQHIQKFYQTDGVGWGHFLLVKGYEVSDEGTFYLEIYDPYSDGVHYTTIDPTQLKGFNRYYADNSISQATHKWWPYAITLAAKGKTVVASTHLQVNSTGKKGRIPVARGR
jgi:hypothetical protein